MEEATLWLRSRTLRDLVPTALANCCVTAKVVHELSAARAFCSVFVVNSFNAVVTFLLNVSAVILLIFFFARRRWGAPPPILSRLALVIRFSSSDSRVDNQRWHWLATGTGSLCNCHLKLDWQWVGREGGRNGKRRPSSGGAGEEAREGRSSEHNVDKGHGLVLHDMMEKL